MTTKPDPSREELKEFYKIAIDEYRFEVRLNWDRMRYYLVLNGAVLGLATSLLRLGRPGISSIFVGVVFVIGILTALLGILAILKGRDYYLVTVYKKTLFEALLGLFEPVEGYPNATLAVTTTRGMQQINEILHNTEQWMKKMRCTRGTIVYYFIWLLVLTAIIDLGGAIFAFAVVQV